MLSGDANPPLRCEDEMEFMDQFSWRGTGSAVRRLLE
jgi:hypothetical protein